MKTKKEHIGHARVLATYAESPTEMRPELVLDAVRYLLAHPQHMAQEILRQQELLGVHCGGEAMRGTSEIVDALGANGYRVTPGTVHSYLRERDLPAPETKVGGAFLWGDADVDRLRSLLRRRGRGPAMAMEGSHGTR